MDRAILIHSSFITRMNDHSRIELLDNSRTLDLVPRKELVPVIDGRWVVPVCGLETNFPMSLDAGRALIIDLL